MVNKQTGDRHQRKLNKAIHIEPNAAGRQLFIPAPKKINHANHIAAGQYRQQHRSTSGAYQWQSHQ